MPHEKEFASGEALLMLENSDSLKDFRGTIQFQKEDLERLPVASVVKSDWAPERVIAIDGSNVHHLVENGYPGADASLIQVSVVAINVKLLHDLDPKCIPRPSLFRKMERPGAVDAVLPGANVVRKDVLDDTPKNYFRYSVFNCLNSRIATNHESLAETLDIITGSRSSNIECPIDGCSNKYKNGDGEYKCTCGENKTLYSTDALRFHERFNSSGSNGEVHGEVRNVLEALVLVNILRFFEKYKISYLKDAAFVLDGPLAISGQPAWISQHIKRELQRLNKKVLKHNGKGLVLFGVEKTGNFVNHFDHLDWDKSKGPRTYYPPRTLLIPNEDYIKRHIELKANTYGERSHYGRKMLYKTSTGGHCVVSPAMLSKETESYECVSVELFPRLDDMLNVMDDLSTFLYHDGFMPLVRAHAQAAIPLSRGIDILKKLFE
ncbi:hypothetical protein [Vibrio natriegens]|uniref:hypothetical protein n=1 Tax=Vibrio natriegens TaxID=691 RepID=UPI003F8777D0